ncbi:hypothetical protein ACRALDRAFT_1063415 [Sodiomyces alcalophilus JCM 7366]|uniref:uncharacterized protein n=1 Tax=Sodiomyces alcalophilus JCM 7366 TaxID=591952 RepID=UPI0039B57E6E
MAKKARQRISYVLDLPNSQPAGHKLGVNGLDIDKDNAILYSGGRDGVVCAWDILDMKKDASTHADTDADANAKPKPSSKFRAQTQAHTHWINDIVLAQNHSALVSASSDLTVKVWRPLSESQKHDNIKIGEHADYAKCVASPRGATWVASGGLDRKIYLWDLNGAGKTLSIDTKGEEVAAKGSVYALSARHHIIASGGPESSVRLWDPRTAHGITKFVGHTDTIRAILLSEAGDTVLTASSDQTIKLWSVAAGRCMYTFTMHNDSVWSLHSDHPDLGIFYSSDRSGLIVKTDVRGSLGDLDHGLSLAVAQEQGSVIKVLAARDHIWSATSTSSINRWPDVDTTASMQRLAPTLRHHRTTSTGTTRSRLHQQPSSPSSPPPPLSSDSAPTDRKETPVIPAKSILRISNTASFPEPRPRDPDSITLGGASTTRKGSEILIEPSPYAPEPIYHLPAETIEGQFGLVKYKLLNDRRRVLTLDTAGDVLLWDLIKCEVIQSYGKRHLEDVEPEVNTLEAVAPWCSIDTSSGSLTVVLEPFNCFDAEMYADELPTDASVEFREDQRINLGKWVLRYLFAKVIDEEIKRDEAHRRVLNEAVEKRVAAMRAVPPLSIELPSPATAFDGADPLSTPLAYGGQPPPTPGLAIGMATPALPRLQDVPEGAVTPTSPMERKISLFSSRPSTDTNKEDYFSGALGSPDGMRQVAGVLATPAEQAAASEAKSPAAGDGGKEKEKDKDGSNGKSPSTPFGKKFRMGMGMGMGGMAKKMMRSASSATTEKQAVVDEKAEESESSSSANEKEVEDSFFGVIQRIRNEYDKQLAENPNKPVETRMTPSLANDTPVLKLPPGTKVIIQEETSGGSANLYQGTVETVGRDTDMIEQRGPMWLGEVLLQNQTPPKEPVKISFVLKPWENSLPDLSAADGNNRLNANRMLRVRKILAYVAERIDPPPEEPDPDALKPEEYLELYCNDMLLPNTMTLATLRAHIWKGGSDIMLYYKANGRKEIPSKRPLKQTVTAVSSSDTGESVSAIGEAVAPVPSTTAA